MRVSKCEPRHKAMYSVVNGAGNAGSTARAQDQEVGVAGVQDQLFWTCTSGPVSKALDQHMDLGISRIPRVTLRGGTEREATD